MDLLVLGGGGFLGYHFVAEARRAGHGVTTFSREGEAPVEGVEALQGDRQGDLSPLRGRQWDAVVDTFSDPEAVGRTARLLSGNVGAYGFVSGISVYHPSGPDVVDEDAPLRRAGDTSIPDDDPLQERSIAKLSCEGVVRAGFDGPVLVLRPGIMVGPRDPTDRFTWWPLRYLRAVTDGGDAARVLAPGDPDRPVQYTDARDLAHWTVRMLDERRGGTFNGVGPGRRETLGAVLAACREAAAGLAGERTLHGPETTWASEDFLRERLEDVEEEARPLWFPEAQIPFHEADSSRATEMGLTFRPALETARDTLAWALENPRDDGPRAGFTPQQEAALLERWRETGA